MMYFLLWLLVVVMGSGSQNPTAETTTMSYEEVKRIIDSMPEEYVFSKDGKEEVFKYMFNLFPVDSQNGAPLKRVSSTAASPTETDDEWEDIIVEPFTKVESPKEQISIQLQRMQTSRPPQRMSTLAPSLKNQPGTTSAPRQVKTQTQEPQHLETLRPSSHPKVPELSTPEPEATSHHSKDCYPRKHDQGSTLAGSVRGIPGIHFPDYNDIPVTSFTCSGKLFVPGFYADLETGCQVFHVCWPHRRESFLCPVGTIFNQAILACDYWYSSNCSLAPHYYEVNAMSSQDGKQITVGSSIGSMIDELIEKTQSPVTTSKPEPIDEASSPATENPPPSISPKPWQPTESDLSKILKFLPVKAKVVVYPESKIVAEASVGSKHKVEPEKFYNPYLEQKLKLPDHLTSRPSVGKILDEVFEAAKKIVEEVEKFVPHMVAFEKVKKPQLGYKPKHSPEEPQPVHKPVPLTELNPRFIIKPAPVPEKSAHSIPAPKVRVRSKVLYEPEFPSKTGKQKILISPQTEKILTEFFPKLYE